jgi:hypothetical protein
MRSLLNWLSQKAKQLNFNFRLYHYALCLHRLSRYFDGERDIVRQPADSSAPKGTRASTSFLSPLHRTLFYFVKARVLKVTYVSAIENSPFGLHSMAEREGFEPSMPVKTYYLSKVAHSTTMRPLLASIVPNIGVVDFSPKSCCNLAPSRV